MKKFLSIAVVLCIITGLSVNISAVDYGEELKNTPPNTYEQKFSDVAPNHWAFNYISEMSSRGVLSGYPDGKFYPNSQVTRAEFAKIMTTAAGLTLAEATMQIFEDVKITDWHAPYIHTSKDFLSSYSLNGKNYYYPNTPALREDIAVALVKLKGYSTIGADMTMVTRMFSDSSSISDSAKIYVATAIENGLISGYDDGTFRGQNSITRAEAATLLWRAYQYGNANKNYDEVINQEKPSSTHKTESDNNSNQAEDEIIIETETERKPFTMKLLAEANLENTELAAIDDDNNIFYIDSSDKCVYKISATKGSKSKFFNPKNLSYELVEEKENEVIEKVTKTVETGEYEEIEEVVAKTIKDEETGEEIEETETIIKKVPITEEITEEIVKTEYEEVTVAEYHSFVPYQVFYDDVNDKILLSGYFEEKEALFSSPENGTFPATYDITSGNAETYFLKHLESYNTSGGYSSGVTLYFAILPNNTAFIHYGPISYPYNTYLYGEVDLVNLNNGNILASNTEYFVQVSCLKDKNSVYSLDRSEIVKYENSTERWTTISEDLTYRFYGMKNDCYYLMSVNDPLYKLSVKTGKTSKLDLTFNDDLTKYETYISLSNFQKRFFVVDDNNIVFYDEQTKAFVLLTAN